jgi:PAS domain S-box-containing protein
MQSNQETEIADLRERLREAEDICQAIRHGEVDAVVTGKSDREKRVLLMSDAYARYRQIVEDMLQGAVTATPSGEILFANHAFAHLVGEPVLDVFRTSLQRWIRPEDHAQMRGVLAPRPGQSDVLVQLARRDGEERRATLSVVSASEDFVTLLVTPVAAKDDEEARAILEAIRKGLVDGFVVDGEHVHLLDSAQVPYRVLVDQMRQGAATVDKEGRVAFANERLSTMLATPLGHIVGWPLETFVIAADRHALRTMLVSRGTAQGELRLARANGDPTAVQAAMTPIDGHRLFLFTDVSERRRHEASDERTRRFLAMLAHEFRNILSPITNSTEILKHAQGLDADGRKAVETIERHTARLIGLVDELRRINPKE